MPSAEAASPATLNEDQAQAQGDLITKASDALYRAFKTFEEDTPHSGDSDYRVHFFDTFRIVTVAVATVDGVLTPERTAAIDQIFWLDRQDTATVAQANAAAPERIEAAVQRLCAMGLDASRFATAYSKPDDADSDPLVIAAEQVFSAVLNAPPTQGAAATLAAVIVARLRAAVPVRPPMVALASAPALPDEAQADPQPAVTPSVPALTPVACPARLHDGELCYAVADASLYQEHNVTRQVRYAGLSARMRIARGISFNAGTYDVDRVTAETTQHMADGTLCVTDQRLIFLSTIKNLDLPFARLLSSETGMGTILVARANGSCLLFDQVDSSAVELFEELSGTSSDGRLQAEATAADMQAIADREAEVADDAPDPVSSGAGATLVIVLLLAAMIVGIILYLHRK